MNTASVNGKTVRFQDIGAGVPLVLLHGFPLDSRIMLDVARRLPTTMRVIVPDLPGFGQSACDQPLTMDSLADDVHALLRQLDALPCVLGGLSMGGYVSLAFAARHPEALRALILIDTRADPDSDDAKRNRERMAVLARERGAKPVIDAMIPRMFADSTAKNRPEIVQRVVEMMSDCPPATIAHASLAMRDRADHRQTLRQLDVPLLLVYGRHDASTPPAVGEELAASAHLATMRVIEDAGHLSPIEQPDAVADAVATFVASLDAGR
jgi:pimeloyl-ACP methyl ester carboxylesterase